MRDSLPEWYERALLSSGVSPVGDPSIEVTSVPEGEGDPLIFQFEVGVRPPAQLGDYMGLEVGRPDPEVPEDVIETELERLREGSARLEAVDRPAAEGDFLLVDFQGSIDGELFQGGAAHDELLELGAGRLIEGFEQQLIGAAGDEEREVNITFPTEYSAEQLAGKDAVFAVQVKEVREKELPESSTMSSPPAPGASTPSRSYATTCAPSCAKRPSSESRPTSGSPPSTPPSTHRRSRSPTRSSPPARPSAGSGSSARSPARGWIPPPICRCRARPAKK